MLQERRKQDLAKPSALPKDFLKMVGEIFNSNFEPGLKAFAKLTGEKASFTADGAIHSSEIILAITLTQQKRLAATTIYGSVDFDPKASAPTVEDLLNVCVDAIGSVFAQLLDPKSPNSKEKLEQLADESLSALEDVPFEWTAVQIEKRKVFLKIDKANPNLDKLADEWLAKNDPELRKLDEETQREMEKLFITGPNRPGGPKKPTH